jgi:hypothetical protein
VAPILEIHLGERLPVGDVVTLDPERVPDHLGGAVSVVAIACAGRLVMRVLLADLDGILPG